MSQPARLRLLGACAAALLALLVAAAWNEDFLYGFAGWCYTQPGGFVPVTILKLAQLLLDRDELKPGRGLDIPASLAGKVALITGSSQGIGLEAAKLFAARGAHVIVSGRTQGTAESAASLVPGATAMSVNLEDFADVRRFAADVSSSFPALDFLLLNAAQSARRFPTAELQSTSTGHDRAYAANYLSNFLLVRLLRLAPGATIVLVSSIVMWGARFDMLMPEGGRVPWEVVTDTDVYMQYQVAKLALCVCLRDSLRAALPGVRVNGMVPGFVITNMTMGTWAHPSYKPWFWMRLAPTQNGGRVLFESAFATPLSPEHDFLYAFWMPAKVFGALRSEAQWPTRVSIGGFYPQAQAYQSLSNFRLHSSVSPECSVATRRALWAWSANATGLESGDPP